MDPESKVIRDFEIITGQPACKFSLDFICGFMACHELMNTTILKANLNQKQARTIGDEWNKLKTSGRILKV